MVQPPDWPERPESAQDFDLFWLVRDLPPLPFPDESFPYWDHRAEFGPPGTRWIYAVADLAARETAPGVPEATKLAANRLLKLLKAKSPPIGSAGWVVPGTVPPPGSSQEAHVPMSWIRTAVVGRIGNDEEFVHTLQWRHSTTENAPVSAANAKTVGDAVRDGFVTFFAAHRGKFGPEVVYTEVRSSVLAQVDPNTAPEWPLSTQVSPFPTFNMNGSATTPSLPYEVSLALSLNTNWRGSSRFRGRLYLPPMAVEVMGPVGQFDSSKVEPVGADFGSSVLGAVEAATDYEAHVISQKYGTSAKITGVRVGKVPDSQRRRRRDRPEAYFQAWGNPVGFFPPGA